MLGENELIKAIQEFGYKYKIHKHAPLHTVQDSVKLRGKIEGSHSKNLFLKNKKNQFFLISCEENSKIDLKKMSKLTCAGNLSFSKKEYMMELIGVNPGSVTPYALLNDKNNKVRFFLEDKLFNSNILNFHPLVNTSTISLSKSNFISFMVENGKKINIFSLDNYEIIEEL